MTTKSESPTFLEALAALLKSRKLKLPTGLKSAPPAAYARQPAEFVAQLAKLDDKALSDRAEHIAGYAKKQQARAKAAWDTSPVIVEIKKRKLKGPERPASMPSGAIVVRKPLADWSNAELLSAAKQWAATAR